MKKRSISSGPGRRTEAVYHRETFLKMITENRANLLYNLSPLVQQSFSEDQMPFSEVKRWIFADDRQSRAAGIVIAFGQRVYGVGVGYTTEAFKSLPPDIQQRLNSDITAILDDARIDLAAEPE